MEALLPDNGHPTSWNTNRWLAWAIIPIVTLVLVVVVVAWLTDFDFGRTAYWTIQRDWFMVINHKLSVWPAAIWANLTLFGDPLVLLPLLSLLVFTHPQTWVAVWAAVPLASLFSVVGKNLAATSRPAGVIDFNQIIIIGDMLKSPNSLPSGHSITVFAGAIAVLAILIPHPKTWRQWTLLIGALFFTAILCLSRIAVGAHWPLDILVGGACGWLAGLSGAALARKQQWWQWIHGTTGSKIFGIIMLVWGFNLLQRALNSPSYDLILWLAALCSCLTALWLLGLRRRSVKMLQQPLQ